MKTQNANTKLAYKKSSVLELNDLQLHDVKGGTSSTLSPVVTFPITVSIIYTMGTFGVNTKNFENTKL